MRSPYHAEYRVMSCYCSWTLWTSLFLICGLNEQAVAQESATAAQDSNQVRDRFFATESEQGVTILEGIRPVLTYQRSMQSRDGRWPRANYVHPVYDLDGEVLTEDFPSDHGHHRGIFWAWHQVLVGDKPAGDAWTCQDFEWRVRTVETRLAVDSAELATDVIWSSPALVDAQGEMLPLVQERGLVRVYPRTDDRRCIDFEISLLALTANIRIGGSDDDKGYGGFSPRIKLSDDLVFSSTQGEVEPQTAAVQAGPWINMSNDRVGTGSCVTQVIPAFLSPGFCGGPAACRMPPFPVAIQFRCRLRSRLFSSIA